VIDPLYIATGGIFFGTMYRTFKPYLRKLKELETEDPNAEIKFKNIYLYSMLSSIVTCLFVTFLVLPMFVFPETPVADLVLFSTAAAFGYTANDITNEGI
jgi:lipopolysaccharide export LptBFGC system permease protein LptF